MYDYLYADEDEMNYSIVDVININIQDEIRRTAKHNGGLERENERIKKNNERIARIVQQIDEEIDVIEQTIWKLKEETANAKDEAARSRAECELNIAMELKTAKEKQKEFKKAQIEKPKERKAYVNHLLLTPG
eukprot:308669_1